MADTKILMFFQTLKCFLKILKAQKFTSNPFFENFSLYKNSKSNSQLHPTQDILIIWMLIFH